MADQRETGAVYIAATVQGVALVTFPAASTIFGNGNWSSLYMVSDQSATTTQASLALTAFWGMVTLGRVVFALIERSFPEQRTYRLLPFVAALALALISILPTGAVPGRSSESPAWISARSTD